MTLFWSSNLSHCRDIDWNLTTYFFRFSEIRAPEKGLPQIVHVVILFIKLLSHQTWIKWREQNFYNDMKTLHWSKHIFVNYLWWRKLVESCESPLRDEAKKAKAIDLVSLGPAGLCQLEPIRHYCLAQASIKPVVEEKGSTGQTSPTSLSLTAGNTSYYFEAAESGCHQTFFVTNHSKLFEDFAYVGP